MTLIASHRGGTHLWPENSRLAFRKTAALPVDLVEFDVHRTQDGALVVHHDSTIDRMTDGKGAIAAMDFAELQRHVIIGTGGETIPTLAEVIDIFAPSPVSLRLELKTGPDGAPYPGMERQVVDLLVERQMYERAMITSFQLTRLTDFRQAAIYGGIDPKRLLGLMWLCSPMVVAQLGWTGVIGALAACQISEIGLNARAIDAETVAKLREAGLVVHAWAAHTEAAALAMFEHGIASFTTDRPDLAIAAREAFAGRR